MRKKRSKSSAALTDIAFLLLLFFMILAIESSHHAYPADQQSLIIDVDSLPALELRHSILTLDNKVIELNDIPYQEQYILKASEDTPYRLIHPIIDHLIELGVDTLSCLTVESL